GATYIFDSQVVQDRDTDCVIGEIRRAEQAIENDTALVRNVIAIRAIHCAVLKAETSNAGSANAEVLVRAVDDHSTERDVHRVVEINADTGRRASVCAALVCDRAAAAVSADGGG